MNEYNTMKYVLNDKAICPYCDHEQTNTCDYGETEYVTKCESCNKKFNVEQVISYKYSTLGINCAVHKLRILNEKVKQFYCIECKRQYYDWQLPNGEFPKLTEKQFTMEN